MELVIHLETNVADWLLKPRPAAVKPSEVKELEDLLEAFGLELRPQHPGVSDPEVRRIFTAQLDRGLDGEAVSRKLKKCEGVSGAYVKPAASLP